jgi:solute carrier family 8 (sodium/calcium exchanger)
MIGIITAIVGEFANLFGCTIGLKSSVTAITIVGMGTSLPDTLASMKAARDSEGADPAIGNVTGSNSVNVFLGLGIPWVLATIIKSHQGYDAYEVPAGDLTFSVAVFLSCAIVGFVILIIRRSVLGGELGGS